MRITTCFRSEMVPVKPSASGPAARLPAVAAAAGPVPRPTAAAVAAPSPVACRKRRRETLSWHAAVGLLPG
jgi:hypothetical protein